MEEKKSSNTIQTFWLGIGSGFSFLVTIASTAILSHYLPKEDYGTYRQVIYIYSTLLTVFSLGLPRAYSYFLPRVNIGEAKSLISKISYLFIGIGVFFSLILFFFAGYIALILKNQDLELALKYFSLTPILLLPTLGLEGILASFKKTHLVAIYTIITRIIMLLSTTLPVILFKLTYLEAIIGFVLGSFLSFVCAWYLKYLPVAKIQSKKTKITYKEIFSFSIPLSLVSIWAMVMNSADQFFISRYFGNETFAEFANGFFEFPLVSMVSAATATVLLPVFSKKILDNENRENILDLWHSTFKKSLILIYPVLIFLIFFADVLINLLFGESYGNSVIYFRLRAIVSFLQIVAFMPLILAMGATKFFSHITLSWSIIIVILELISVTYFHSPILIAIISVFCKIGIIISILLYISKKLDVPFFDLIPYQLQIKVIFSCLTILFFLKEALNLLNIEYGVIFVIIVGVLYLICLHFIFMLLKINYQSIFSPILSKLKRKK